MKEIKKLTVTDLMKNKEQYQVKENVTEEVYIDRLGASVTIRKPEKSLCIEGMQMAQDPNLVGKSDAFIVYNVLVEPNLKDKQLQKEFGCVEPTDIVDKIFEPGEIGNIAKLALELVGYTKALKKVKDLKN
ncbi:hypothetical protein CON65_15920 [Bacillus pseudomycoides]|uniref:Phage XkdN-like protein n=1 Tax=Bacillus pseudomycoides TaxID=64104 RepID=A0AA91VAQ6_9BACI|nr:MULTISPECIES: hypothetical protein [Bacillus]PEB56243.1 hypothetical protein COO03_01355 [Bacillus sp. AFS098217]PED81673.1 hypothetical protein CON65_15920 [Bacillus pseudomycoides]